MRLFTLTKHCESRVHCQLCRSKEKGRQWRQSLAKNHRLPNDDVDFDCPYGIAWDFNDRSPEKMITKTVEENSVSKVEIPKIETPKIEKVEKNRSSGVRNSGSRSRGCGCGRA